MELRRYLDIIVRRWWIALTAFAVTTGATMFWVLPQPKVYESAGTFVVGPRAVNDEASVRAFDTLSRGEAINATYASIASSDLVRARAEARVDPSIETDGLEVSAEVLTGTNILEISVRGLDPEAVRELAVAVSQEAVSYVSASDEGYKLSLLDEPRLNRSPVAPNKPLIIATGVFFGALLGLGLAFVIEYLAAQLGNSSRRATADEFRNLALAPNAADLGGRGSAAESMVAAGTATEAAEALLDQEAEEETGIHDERSLKVELKREIDRASRGEGAFSFALMSVTVEVGGGPTLPRSFGSPMRIARVLRSTLREEDTLARLDDGRLAVVLRDMPATEAEALMLDWEMVVASLAGRDNGVRASAVHVTTGVCGFEHGRFSGDHDVVRIAEMLSDLPDTTSDVREPSSRTERAAGLR
jgi:capsular polysaccharide biosynthesis protein